MTLANRTLSLAVLLTTMLLPLTACSTLSSKAIEGKVLEQGTNKPISDAIVIARWKGFLPGWGHGNTVCYHVLTTTTDTQGQYQFPAWKKEPTEDWQKHIKDQEAIVTAYKPGYQLANEYPVNNPRLVLFRGTREERFEYIKRVFSSTGCDVRDGSDKNVISFLRVLHDEAQSFAQTEDEKKIVEFIRYAMEEVELGFEEAQKRHLQRAK